MRATPAGVLVVTLWGSLVAARPVYAQEHRALPRFETQVASPRVTAGSKARLRLKVVLPDGLHVQSDKPRDPSLIPTILRLAALPHMSTVRTTYPKATDLPQPGRDQPLAVFSGTFAIDVEIAVGASVRAGTLDVPGELRYQSCTAQVCFPPSRAAVTWHVRVSPSAPR